MRSSRHLSLGEKDNMKEIGVAVLALIGFLVLLIGFSFLFAYPTMWLVNWLFSSALLTFVFATAKITVWQAWALNVLFGAWFKSTSTTSTK
jgi:hypothetical protein